MNSFWKNRAVFVTGAGGFIGAHIVSELLQKEANVVCLLRNAVGLNSLDLLNLRNKVKVIKGSVEDLGLLKRTFDNYEIDAVFHLAAQALVGAANRSPLSTFESNIRGTYMLLEACRRSDTVKRIAVSSSVTAYGTHENFPFTEDFCLQGRFPYDASKACTDLISQSFAFTYKLPLTIIRAANTYGTGDLNFSRIIPGTILSVLKNQSPVIRSDGSPIREFIFVEDVVKAFLLLTENIESSQGEAFNLGTNNPLKIIDLVQKILDLSGKSQNLEFEISLKTKIEKEIDAEYLSSDKINEKFNWQPEVNLEEGLLQTIDWYRENLDILV